MNELNERTERTQVLLKLGGECEQTEHALITDELISVIQSVDEPLIPCPVNILFVYFCIFLCSYLKLFFLISLFSFIYIYLEQRSLWNISASAGNSTKYLYTNLNHNFDRDLTILFPHIP